MGGIVAGVRVRGHGVRGHDARIQGSGVEIIGNLSLTLVYE